MARGDFTVFNEFLISLGEKLINLETDTIKLGLIDNAVTPLVDTATPTWDVTSSQEYDGNEVATSAEYPAGGLTLSGPELVRLAAVATFDDDDSDLSIAQNGAGFTDAYWGILYSDTATAKNAIGFLDMGGPVSQQAGPININWSGSGILTITRT